MRKNLLLPIFALLLLIQLIASPVAAATRVFLCSRLEFTPALLDMLRRSFSRKLGINDTIILQPLDRSSNVDLDASGSLVLIEHGMDTSFLPEGYSRANNHIDLVWALVASMRIPGLPITQPVDGERFAALLRDLKQQSPERYPWFESLNSRVTLRNFDVLFSASARPDNNAAPAVASAAEQAFWQQSDAIIYLYRAIEEHLLNPFSIEADLGLAMNVFEADDAMFVSQWIPAEFLDDERLCRENLGKVRLLPFPVFSNQKYLRIRLCLYSQPTQNLNTAEEVHEPDDRFIDLDYVADMEWIEKKSADRYDALIIGGF
ncbi:MAG: hypothetical protein GQF41_3252 [Candidatus Rifleibacterium amylolyticum]|nr:MAG: hypothetical protein GQF41_3252 [Candidatus Rifleibacterium amylolyticum]NLF97391.1 hypothetical protein [Candidatus Riflebacteria bacterium]